jgi:hypothetical protein
VPVRLSSKTQGDKWQPFNNNTPHSATMKLKTHINILLFLCLFVADVCVKLYALLD